MKVLIVDAFSGSRSGRHSFAKFGEIVRRAFQVVERFEQGRTEFDVRHFSNGLQVWSCGGEGEGEGELTRTSDSFP